MCVCWYTIRHIGFSKILTRRIHNRIRDFTHYHSIKLQYTHSDGNLSRSAATIRIY